MSLSVTDKEAALDVLRKMDAVSVQGVWLAQYPAISARGTTVVAGRYLALLAQAEEEARRSTSPRRETKTERHRRVLGELETLLQQEDDDDLVTALAF